MNFKNPIFLTKPILKNILENWAVVSKVLLSYLCFSAVIFWLPSDLTGQVFPVIVHFPYLWRRSVSLLFLPRTMLHHRVECGRLLMVVDYSLLIIMTSRLLSKIVWSSLPHWRLCYHEMLTLVINGSVIFRLFFSLLFFFRNQIREQW